MFGSMTIRSRQFAVGIGAPIIALQGGFVICTCFAEYYTGICFNDSFPSRNISVSRVALRLSDLDFLNHNLTLRKLRQVYRLLDHTDRVNEILSGFLQRRALCERPWNIFRPDHPPLLMLHEVCSDLHSVILVSSFKLTPQRCHAE